MRALEDDGELGGVLVGVKTDVREERNVVIVDVVCAFGGGEKWKSTRWIDRERIARMILGRSLSILKVPDTMLRCRRERRNVTSSSLKCASMVLYIRLE